MLRALLLLLAGAGSVGAQQADVRSRLTARGLPADLVEGVAAVATQAQQQGLPVGPIADKALEGFAKRVPAARILAAVQQTTARMGEGREAVRAAGVEAPDGDVVAAAGEAMGRGMTREQVAEIVRAAHESPAAAPGLRVTAALAAQGMPVEQAVAVVSAAMRERRPVAQILDLPSTMRAMMGQGMSPPDVGRRMLQGGTMGPGPGGSGPGMGRPGGVQPGTPGGPRPPGGMRPPGEMPPGGQRPPMTRP